jgi:hypothetical protein
MYVIRRLKSDSPFPALFLPIGALALFVILALTAGPNLAYYVMAIFFVSIASYTFAGFLRTGNGGMLVVAAYQLSVGAMLASAPPVFTDRGSRPGPVTGSLLVLVFFLGVWMVVLLLSKRLKWRGRDLLELAAQSVDETSAVGYTARPRPVGTATYTDRELADFADYCRRKLVAMPFTEPNRIVLIPVIEGEAMRLTLGLYSNYEEDTWVAFDKDGNVTAHMSRRDYLRYREDLSFDQLCASLGQVFIEFLDLFVQGNDVRITDRLNAMPVTVFS